MAELARLPRPPSGKRFQPALSGALRDYANAVTTVGGVDPILSEIVRIRIARSHDCRT